MLKQCPECELQVSEKAITCPHCGFPLMNVPRNKILNKPKRAHKRLPNGFGSITEVKNKDLRNPFLARITVGKKPNGAPILKHLKPQAYFRTYNEAYEALVEYNKNPYDVSDVLTLQDLFERWTTEYFKNIEENSARTVKSAWNYCHEVYDMRVVDLRARHIKGVIDNGYVIVKEGKHKGETKYASPSIKERIKSNFNLMLDFAIEYEIGNITHNVARTFNIGNDVLEEAEKSKIPHIPFKDEEIDLLWKNINYPYTELILFNIYSGWRPQEISTLKLKDVNINEMYIEGGMKTPAGKGRFVPIHPKVQSIAKKYYDYAIEIGSEYFINVYDNQASHKNNVKMTYDKYSYRFEKVIEYLDLNPDHRPHDCRMTFVTKAKNIGVDEYAIKRLVGHKIKDITEAIYTERSNDWLREELNKIE